MPHEVLPRNFRPAVSPVETQCPTAKHGGDGDFAIGMYDVCTTPGPLRVVADITPPPAAGHRIPPRTDTYRPLPYARALEKARSQCVEAILRQRRLLFAEALVRQFNRRLPTRMMIEKLVGAIRRKIDLRPWRTISKLFELRIFRRTAADSHFESVSPCRQRSRRRMQCRGTRG